MAGEQNGIAFQSQGQGTVPASPPVEQGQANATQEALTLDAVKAMLDQQKKDLLSEMQSRVDKASFRIDKQTQAKITALESAWKLQADAGIPVDPAVQQQVKDKLIQDAQPVPEPPQPSTPQPAQAVPAQGEAVHPVMALATDIIRKAGLDPQADIPEWADVDKSTDDPVVYLASVKAAVEKYQARTSVPAGARAPAAPVAAQPGNPLASINDPRELYARAFKK